MMLSKVFALSLLLVCPAALARLQLDANIQINHAQTKSRSIESQVQLDAQEASVVIYQDNDMQVEARVLSELENEARVRYAISVKNAEGVYELMTAPEICAVYGETATIDLGQKTQNAEQSDSFKMTLRAIKI